MKSKFHNSFLPLATALAALLSGPSSHAANETWDGGAGTGTAWFTNTNWLSDTGYAGSQTDTANVDIATFTATGTGSPIGINMNFTGNMLYLGAIQMTGNTARLIGNSSATGGTLVLNGATVNSVSNTILRNSSTSLMTLQASQTGGGVMGLELGNATTNTIQITSTGGITISSIISGVDKSLRLQGGGTGALTLSGVNTYSGGTTLAGGTLVLNNNSALGGGELDVTATSSITAVNGITTANKINIGTSTLTLTLTNAAAATSTFSGQLTGSGIINIGGSGSGNNQTVLDFTNTNNTFTGNIVGASGNVNGADYFRFASIGDGGNFTFDKGGNRGGVIYSGASAIEFDVRQIVLGTSLSTGNGTIGGYTVANLSGLNGNGAPINSFVNNASNSAHTVTFNADMAMTSIAGNSFFYFDGSNAGNNTFDGDIGDPTGAQTLGIGKWGTGKWILSGDNSFLGDLLVANGTLAATTIDVAANNQSIGKGSFIILGHANTSGTLEYIGSADASTNKQVVLGNIRNNNQSGAGGIVNNSTTGKLTFTNATFNSIAGNTLTTRDRTLILGGTNASLNNIEGVIQDNNSAGVDKAAVALTKTDTGTWVLSNTANTYTGATTINGGVLNVAALSPGGSNSSIGAAAVANTNLVLNGGTLRYSGSAATSTNRIFSVGTNGATFDASGTGSGTMSFTGTTAIGYNSQTTARTITLTGSNAGNNTMAVIIGNNTGATSLAKSGTGTWVLSGTNTYTGGTSINGGTLDVANVRGMGASGTLSINAASTTRLSTDTAFGGSNPVYNMQMTGVAGIGGGYTSTIELNRATAGAVTGITHNFGSMTISLNGGGAATLNVTAGANAPTGGALDTIAFTSMSAGNNNIVTETLNPTGGNITIGNLTAFGNQMVTMNLSGTTAGNAITGVIGGTGNQNLVAIRKSNSSTWTLSGASTYSGGTTVTGGTLLVNNTVDSGTGSGAVTVDGGATLGGTGTIAGSATVSGILSPGLSPGVLSFGSTLTLTSTAETIMEIDAAGVRGTDFDGVNVTDSLTYAGALTLVFGTTFDDGVYTFNLFDMASETGEFSTVTIEGDYTASLNFDNDDVWELEDGDNTWTFTQSTGILNLTVVPETSTTLLGALGALALLRRRRR